jgi:hypothetical protein
MKIKLLPNWCKKLGLAIFIIGFITSGIKGWNSVEDCSPYQSNSVTISESSQVKKQDLESVIPSNKNLDLDGVIVVIGMFIYMFSKEKIEDDYINILRLESFQLTSLIGLVSVIIIYLISGNISFNIDSLTNLFLIFYLIIFAIKKRIY